MVAIVELIGDVVKFLLVPNMADMGCLLCEDCGVSKAEYLVHSI